MLLTIVKRSASVMLFSKASMVGYATPIIDTHNQITATHVNVIVTVFSLSLFILSH